MDREGKSRETIRLERSMYIDLNVCGGGGGGGRGGEGG